jgi:Acetyltransferase (GNAT) domain
VRSQPVAFSLERPDAAALQALWTGLEQRADITFYMSWLWIGTWIAEAGPPDFVLVGRAGGEVVCLGLLRKSVQWRHKFVRSRTLCLHETGKDDEDVIFIEYNGFLTDRRFKNVGPQAIAFLRASGGILGGFDELQLGGFVEADYEAVRAGCKTYVHARKTTAFVDLAAIRDRGGDYLSTISGNTRYQIRRALKIYESRGALTLEPARTTQQAIEFFEELGVLHEGAWRARGPGGAWRFPFLIRFHKRLIETAFPAGGIEIVRVSCGETPIGYIHCLVRDGWIGSYLSGFAYEADNKVKPGLVSFYLYIEHKLKSSGQTIDFLAGDHRYKTSLGQPGPLMYWFRVQERRPQLMIEDALRYVKQRIEKMRTKPAGSSGD